ncbi:cytochrome P450-like protein 8 [Sarcoptes scabiei]|uniref:Cytochrome P450-like protein 8 n=1 Tax=Sarcoptes scabiei TaxID=52283 RepID=A0A131ZY94_SARSC|nr:cytochrome P450-like protein 8 [Sarcoptes scabiei]
MNAHSDPNNLFVKNAKKIIDLNFFRTMASFLTSKSIFDILVNLKIPFFYSDSNEYFKNLCSHLIKQRKEFKNNDFDDMLQLMVDARLGKDERYEKADEFDSFQVNLGKEEIEKENELFKDIIGSKYLNEEEIVAQSIIFFAGYETTATTIAICLYELAINEAIQKKLFDEIQSILDDEKQLDYSSVMILPYLDAVLSETLRKYPPTLLLTRDASTNYHIEECDITIEKDKSIMIPVYAIHHDPEYYPDPERFDPERFMPENRHKLIPYTYLPFGCGPRNCIGMRFALMKAKLAIANLVQKFRIIRVADTPNSLKLQNSIFFLKTEPIHLGMEKK